MGARGCIVAGVVAACVASSAGPASATSVAIPTTGAPRPGWAVEIDRLVGGLPVGVSVRDEGVDLYGHGAARRRAPASNEKLVLSMALLNALGPEAALVTQAVAGATPVAGILAGDLWILGSGDPDIRDATMRLLAQRVRDAGGIHVSDPELRAARALRRELREIGVSVAGPATAAEAPTGLVSLAEITSDPLAELLDTMNRYSSNFWAEVLVKRLGVEVAGVPGSIAKGAAALQGFAAGWGVALRGALPEPGQGTLGGRLRHLQVHAKTGTLRSISALSGYVWLRRAGSWASFSILTRDVSKSVAVRLEDRIVRILARRAS